LFGGVGNDRLIVANGNLPDELNIVGDFADGIDRILISGKTSLGLSADQISLIQEGNDVLIVAPSQNIARILNINVSVLTKVDDNAADSISID
jgi:Ca2+-binding RTX toxin-like protein